jgi:hypothetical protein
MRWRNPGPVRHPPGFVEPYLPPNGFPARTEPPFMADRSSLAVVPTGNKLEPMAKNDETATVTIEVEMADTSEEPDGSYKSVINVRIIGSQRHACDQVKDALLLAIQVGLGEDDESEDAPTEPMH